MTDRSLRMTDRIFGILMFLLVLQLTPVAAVPIPEFRPIKMLPTIEGLIGQQEARSIEVTSNADQYGDKALFVKFQQALKALDNKQTEIAIALRDSMPRHTIEHKTLSWVIGITASGALSFSQFLQLKEELRGWPNSSKINSNFEEALVRAQPAPAEIIALFSQQKPQTAMAMILLGEALVKQGQSAKANHLIAPWWHKTKLTAHEEQLVIQKLGGILTKEDHRIRLQRMLYAKQLNSAHYSARLAEATSLYRGAKAVILNEANARQYLASIDRFWQSKPVSLFYRIQFLRRAGNYEEASKLMIKAPRNAAALLDPDAWWIERRALSREMLDLGRPDLAYQLVAFHSAESATNIVDAEFHAGWYALRFLNKPKIAMKHFSHIAEFSSRPISQARSFYWMARASEAMRDQDRAWHYYRQAARHGTSFYGQLAASRLRENKLSLYYPRPNIQERQHFAKRESVQAIKLLEAANHGELAKSIYQNLSGQLNSPGELALLAAMAEKQNDYQTSLKIGKQAVQRGIVVGTLSHPLGAIPASSDISNAGKALAYAVARQESEFNPKAISAANARGMLQLLPGTAKAVAARKNVGYSLHKLTTDPAYNAMLGAHFLAEQMEQFDNSYILTFVSYNAGPARARQWIARYGDPRRRSIEETIDWIERIPFTETRNYVQRIMENYQVYKARLTGKTDIVSDLVIGRN